MIPNFVIITHWLGWYDTYQAQIVPLIGSVFAIFLLRQFFLTIPKDLEDARRSTAARTCASSGASSLPLSARP